MSIQVSNITSIESAGFKFIDLTGGEKSLPLVNSVAAIHVLDRVKDGYKVLIDGRVFFAKLPVNAAQNDIMLARVVSQHPFILSLNNILASKSIEESISVLLSKLQLPFTNESDKIIKSFLLNKKPVIKSKLEKLSDLLKSTQIELSENELSEVISFLDSSENNYQYISASLLKLFKSNNTEIAEKILDSVQKLNNIIPSNEIINDLNNSLVLDLNESEALSPLALKEHMTGVKKTFGFITRVWDKMPSGKAGEILKDLIASLLVYNFRRALTSYTGCTNSFIIIKVNDRFDLIECSVTSVKNTFSFNLKMNPGNLGRISTHGMYSESRVLMDIISETYVNNFLAENSEDLKKSLEESVKCRLNIKFSCSGQELIQKSGITNGEINARF